MMNVAFALPVLLLVACSSGGGSTGEGQNSPDAGEDRDGGANIKGTTWSPTACQAEITLHQEAADSETAYPVAYKGDYFGVRRIDTGNGPQLAVLNLRTEAIMAITGQVLPGFDAEESLTLFGAQDMAVAPDLGDENDPDHPLAFVGEARIESPLESRSLLLRSDGEGTLQVVLSQGQTVAIPRPANFILPLGGADGVVESFENLVLGPTGSLLFELTLENDPVRYLVRQDQAGGPLELFMAEGDPLNTGEETTVRTVGTIQRTRISPFSDVLMNIDVLDELGVREGFAEMSLSMVVPDTQCLATDSALFCGGVLIPDGYSLADDGFGGDGAAFGAVLYSPNGPAELHYKVLSLPVTEELRSNEPFQGYTIEGVGRPRSCTSKNRLYFVGTVVDPTNGRRQELFRFEEDGTLAQLTDFGSLLSDPSLEGEVPDTIKDYELGYDCDLVLYAWGPSGPNSSLGYEGYWAVYDDGDVVEILDETPGRPNGNGPLADVQRARSGLDPNADQDAIVNIGPDGEFYFLSRLTRADSTPYRQYAVATRPAAGCPTSN